MIGAAQLARMKPGAQPDQRLARHGGRYRRAGRQRSNPSTSRGAAIDVFPMEPKSASDEFVSPLRGMDNVILTPHVGGSTRGSAAEYRHRGGREADQVQQQRLHARRRQLPRGLAAGASRQAPPAAHPPQPAGRAVGRSTRSSPSSRSTSPASICRPMRRSAMW